MKVLGNVSGGGVASAGGGSVSTSKIVTASSDGKVNYWSVSNLREPVENVMVDANLSCLDVLYGDSANNESVVCGDERGGVHAIFPGTGRDGSSSNKRVIRTLHPGGVMGIGSDPSVVEGDADAASAGAVDELSEMGHFGMVTSVATRPVMPAHGTPRKGTTASSKGFVRGAGGLMVTTGVDWSTKLWAPAYHDRPLMSFLSNSYDYMCDAQW
jgi:dynein intermediate chain